MGSAHVSNTPRRARSRPVVHSVSRVPTSAREDQSKRLRAYLITMGLRTASFMAAGVALMVFHHTAAALIASALAVVLPYPAVIAANAADRHRPHPMTPADDVRHVGGPQASPTNG